MNGLELFILGRKLMKLGEEAMPPSGLDRMAPSVRSVLVDVFGHPGSSVSEITGRTGFPQSHVSASVARLRDLGVLLTEPDPADRRRTLVRAAPGRLERGMRAASAAPPVDAAVARAVGTDGEPHLADVLAALELLGRVVTPEIYQAARLRPAAAP